MFIFSIIPLHLSKDSDGVAVNQTNEVDVVEHRIMELEALLTGLYVQQYVGYVSDISNTNQWTVQSELYKLREQELALMQDTSNISDNDSELRLDYVQRMQTAVDTRINDLTMLYNNLINGTQSEYFVSGVDNTNLYSVSLELQRNYQYKQELEQSKLFWEQLVQQKIEIAEGGTGSLYEDDIDPNLQIMLALSKKTVFKFAALFGSVSQDTDITEILAKIDEVEQQLTKELKKFKPSKSSSNKVVDYLKFELQGLMDLKNTRELMSGVQVAIHNKLNEALSNLASLL